MSEESPFMQKLVALVREEEGQSLVEYGLILGIVSVALITVLTSMRNELGKIFETVQKALKTASAAVKK
jgi:pilus assembly protein Flp/PilA